MIIKCMKKFVIFVKNELNISTNKIREKIQPTNNQKYSHVNMITRRKSKQM